MNFLFLDTSAFIKLYLKEKGSRWIRRLVKSNQILISELTLAEATNVVTRLYRNGNITRRKVRSVLKSIGNKSDYIQIIPLKIEEQISLLATLGLGLPGNLRLRTLDSIQIVAAEIAKNFINSQDPAATFIFVSSDRQLLQVAQARGFTTENPENYP
jgi:predicted nucleic acid-binding protein